MKFQTRYLSRLIKVSLFGLSFSALANQVIPEATPYQDGSSYSINDVVEHNGFYYRCEGAFWQFCGNSAYEPGNANGFWATGAWTQIGPVPQDEDDADSPENIPEVAFYHGITWNNDKTSSVEYVFSQDLDTLTIVYPPNVIAEVRDVWQSGEMSFERREEGDVVTLRKNPTTPFAVTQMGYTLELVSGHDFRSLSTVSSELNGKQVKVLNHGIKADAVAAPSQMVAGFDPFPKTVDEEVVTRYFASKATHKTFKRPTYTDDSGQQQEYLIGGYYTDWGVYPATAYTPNLLPVNNLNFIQVSFAAICGEGDASNWFGNESATPEARPKIAELCVGKPTGTMIIPDHFAHYGKADMNLPEWERNWNKPAYHVPGYIRHLLNPFTDLPAKEFFNVGEKQLIQQEGYDYAWGLKNDFSHYDRILNRHGKNFDMYLSIGGWTLSDPFPVIAANPGYTQTFVNSVINYLVLNPHISGIDIDWEFVGVDGAKAGAMGARDTNNFTKFIYSLRQALDQLGSLVGRDYQLSAALGTAPKHLTKVNWTATTIDGKSYPGIGEMLDHLFLMSYDYYGAWDTKVGHHTALHTNGDLVGHSVDSAVQYLKGQGINSRKIVIGYAGYGRLWANAKPSADNESGAYAFPNQAQAQYPGQIGTVEAANVAWRHIKATAYDNSGELKPNYRFVRDETAKAEFLIATNPEDESKNIVVTLDTPWSVEQKAKYVVDQKLGGMFTWALDNDNGDLLNAAHLGLGSTKISDSMIPTARQSSLLLYRSKEAEYCSNPNVKAQYALNQIARIAGDFFTFGAISFVEGIQTGLNLISQSIADNKSLDELTDAEWEEYFDFLRGLQMKDGSPTGLDESKLSKTEIFKIYKDLKKPVSSIKAAALMSKTTFLKLGFSAASDFVADGIFDLIGIEQGNYCDRITRDTLNPWTKMGEDFPILKENFGY